MSLPARITLLLAGIIILFVCMHSLFLYTQIERGFRTQAGQRMLLCTTLLQQRIDFLHRNLTEEMDRLSRSLFSEDETTLADMMSVPPRFTPEVVRFAETLRRRTTLDSLTMLSAEGIILSSSEHPASYGKPEAHPDLPEGAPAYLWEENQARLVLAQGTEFGRRRLILKGAYSLREEVGRQPFPGLDVAVHERGGWQTEPPEPTDFSRTIFIRDYRGAPLLLVTVSFSPAELLAQRERIINNSIITLVLSMALCLVLGGILSRWISRPVARLTEAARAMSAGRLDARVPEDAGGEVGELQTAFNLMAGQLEEQRERLIQSERIAAWQEIARHLAHEIKNPLTPIRTSITNLRLALEKAPDRFAEIFPEASGSVLEEVEKLRKLADEFSRFARLPAPELQNGDLNELIRKCLLLYEGTPGIRVEFQPDAIPNFAFDPDQITEVLHNLLRNAIQAMPYGGTIRIGTTATGNPPAEIQLTIEDSGAGMSHEVQRQIFTPYFTTRAEGTGLGLPIVARILGEHNATIRVDSEPGKGSRFVIRFAMA